MKLKRPQARRGLLAFPRSSRECAARPRVCCVVRACCAVLSCLVGKRKSNFFRLRSLAPVAACVGRVRRHLSPLLACFCFSDSDLCLLFRAGVLAAPPQIAKACKATLDKIYA